LTLFTEVENNKDIALSVSNFIKASLLRIGDMIEKSGPYLKAKVLEVNSLIGNLTSKRGMDGVNLESLMGPN